VAISASLVQKPKLTLATLGAAERPQDIRFLLKNPAKLNLLKNPLNYKAKSQKAGLPNVLFWCI